MKPFTLGIIEALDIDTVGQGTQEFGKSGSHDFLSGGSGRRLFWFDVGWQSIAGIRVQIGAKRVRRDPPAGCAGDRDHTLS